MGYHVGLDLGSGFHAKPLGDIGQGVAKSTKDDSQVVVWVVSTMEWPLTEQGQAVGTEGIADALSFSGEETQFECSEMGGTKFVSGYRKAFLE